MKVLLDHNNRTFLLTHEGRKFNHGVALAAPVRKIRVPISDMKFYRVAVYRDKPYPVSRAKRRLREAGRHLGITKGAAKELRA